MKAEKQLLLDDIKEQIERHDSFLIMRYTAITANSIGDFRNAIAQMGGDVEMMRKRLLMKAAEAQGVHLDREQLQGHISVIFGGDDPLEITKYVFKFGKESNNVEVIAALLDGRLYDGKQAEMLSQLPSMPQMRAQLLATFEAPMSQTLAAIEALLTSVLYCLENKGKEE